MQNTSLAEYKSMAFLVFKRKQSRTLIIDDEFLTLKKNIVYFVVQWFVELQIHRQIIASEWWQGLPLCQLDCCAGSPWLLHLYHVSLLDEEIVWWIWGRIWYYRHILPTSMLLHCSNVWIRRTYTYQFVHFCTRAQNCAPNSQTILRKGMTFLWSL